MWRPSVAMVTAWDWDSLLSQTAALLKFLSYGILHNYVHLRSLIELESRYAYCMLVKVHVDFRPSIINIPQYP